MMQPYNDDQFLTILKQVFHEKDTVPFFLTTQEQKWLRYLLEHEQAEFFLEKQKIQQLLSTLVPSTLFESAIIQKQRPIKPYPEPSIYSTLCQLIDKQQGMLIDYQFLTGERFCEKGIPYKLYFSIQHERWYVWWVILGQGEMEERRRRTPLTAIHHVEPFDIQQSDYVEQTTALKQHMNKTNQLTLRLQPQFETMDEQWFLQAFSSFQKTVQRDEQTTLVTIFYTQEDEAFLLSKIREFGPHLFVVSPPAIQKKMLETSRKAAGRYMD